MLSKHVIKIDRGMISPPKYSRFNSSRVGNFRILADISVHKPTAIISAKLLPSTRGVMSKQATSYSKLTYLRRKNNNLSLTVKEKSLTGNYTINLTLSVPIHFPIFPNSTNHCQRRRQPGPYCKLQHLWFFAQEDAIRLTTVLFQRILNGRKLESIVSCCDSLRFHSRTIVGLTKNPGFPFLPLLHHLVSKSCSNCILL